MTEFHQHSVKRKNQDGGLTFQHQDHLQRILRELLGTISSYQKSNFYIIRIKLNETEIQFTYHSLPNFSDPRTVIFNQTLLLPNCKELLGRKIRLLWQQVRKYKEFLRQLFKKKVKLKEMKSFPKL